MNIFIILFIYLNITISLAYCEDQELNYYKIELKNNGSFYVNNVSIDENEFNNKDDKTFSIVNDQTLTIFQKKDGDQYCSFSYVDDANATIDDCRYRNTNKDNICCFLNITGTNFTNISDISDISKKITWKRCVQVNKYEIKRFRGIPRVNYDKINATKIDKGMIQCSSNYYKINELIIFGLLFMFLNF